MTVNRYDKPVLSEYISQYTPIPFEQLYNLGKQYNEMVDKAYNELSTNLAKWAEFKSPSAKDTQKWYDVTTGGAQNIVNQLAANPDLIKTQEGRAMISSYINSRPYALLSNLQETAQNAEARNKMVAEMKAKGLYADWMDDPRLTPTGIANWDTESMGIMNDIAPIQFQDLQTIGTPYVKDLKPTFYSKVDPNTGQRRAYTDWMSITANDIARSFLPALTDITSTPQGRAWYNRYAQQVLTQNPDATKADIDQVFLNALVLSQADKIISTPVVDEASLKLAELNRKYPSGGQLAATGPMTYTQQLDITGMRNFANAFANIKNSQMQSAAQGVLGKINQLLELLQKKPDDVTLQNQMKDQQEQLGKIINQYSNYSVNNYVTELFDNAMRDKSLNKGKGITSSQTNKIVDQFMRNFGYTLTAADNNLLATLVPNLSQDTETTPAGDVYIIRDVSGLTLQKRFIMNLLDKYKFLNSGSLNRIENATKSGKLTGLYLLNAGTLVSLPVQTPQGVASETKQVIRVGIPENSLKEAGITPEDVKLAGGHVEWYPSKDTSTTTLKYKKDKNGNMVQATLKDKKATQTLSNKEQLYEPVYVLNYMNDIPMSNEGLRSFSLNQQAWELGMSKGELSKQYGYTQQQTYGRQQNEL